MKIGKYVDWRYFLVWSIFVLGLSWVLSGDVAFWIVLLIVVFAFIVNGLISSFESDIDAEKERDD